MLAGLLPGTIINNDFRVVRPLSEGGMGAVFVVEQLSTGALRALKVIHGELSNNTGLRQRFEQEARVSSRIASDHVVQVMAAGVDPASQIPWLVMELLQGRTLASAVAEDGPFTPERTVDIFYQLCHALSAAHAANVVHRDIKPENIFLAESQRQSGSPWMVKVLDFGIARVRDEGRTARTAAIGTPLWMAPEQTASGSDVAFWTDIWPLGLLAFWMLTGHEYWMSAKSGDPTMSVMREILFDPLVPASQRAAALGVPNRFPPAFDGWFARCVVRAPAERFPTVLAARDALVSVLQGPPSPAHATIEAGPRTELPMRTELPGVDARGPQTGHASAPIAWPAQGSHGQHGQHGQHGEQDKSTSWQPPVPPYPAYGPVGQTQVRPAGTNPKPRPPSSSSTLWLVLGGIGLGGLFILVLGMLAIRSVMHSSDETKCADDGAKTEERLSTCEKVCSRNGDKDPSCITGAAMMARKTEPSDLKAAYQRLSSVCDLYATDAACRTASELAAFPPHSFQSADPSRSVELAKKGCASGPLSCAMLGAATELGMPGSSGQVPISLYQRACDASDPIGCSYLVAALYRAQESKAVALRVKSRFSAERACDNGDFTACAAASTLDEELAPKEAAAYARKGCSGGDALSCNELGVARVQGVDDLASAAQALAQFEMACKGGEPAACNNIGAIQSGLWVVRRVGPRGATMYKLACQGAIGIGCAGWGQRIRLRPAGTPSVTDAVASFEEGCKNGLQTACVNLGALLMVGRGTARNPQRARELFQHACDGGDAGGCGEAGTHAIQATPGHPADYALGDLLIKRACDGGEIDACIVYADLLFHGRGMVANPNEARSRVEQACGQTPFACTTLGYFDLEGVGGRGADPVAARKNLQKGCIDDGTASHCSDYAAFLYNGQGGPKDRPAAKALLRKACAANEVNACVDLAYILTDDDRDFAGAFKIFDTHCTLGFAAACNGLAHAYIFGNGVPKDVKRGADLAKQACEEGFFAACSTYGLLLADGVGMPRDVEAAKPFLVDACSAKVTLACTKLTTLRVPLPAPL